jgi:hypothetical protein
MSDVELCWKYRRKHYLIKCPLKADSQFYNYKSFHSAVLFAVADSDCSFILIDVGGYDRDNDSKMFSEYSTGKALSANKVNIPAQQKIGSTDSDIPFYLVGDEAFPLQQNLMKPFPRRQFYISKRIFNSRLSRARRTVECDFGVSVRKFGLFTESIETHLELLRLQYKALLFCIIVFGNGRTILTEFWRRRFQKKM